MVKRRAILVICRSADSRATSESLLHLRSRAGSTVRSRARSAERLGARSTGQVSVTSNWGEVRWAGREVVIERVTTGHVLIATRVEGSVRRVGCVTMKTGQSAIFWASRLPVDGLDSVLESGRGLELPLADKCPNDGDRHDARSQHSTYSDCGVLIGGGCSSGLSIARIGGLRA